MAKITRKLSAMQECVALALHISGMTTGEMEKVSGVSVDTIYRASKGVKEISVPLTYAICEASGYDFESIMWLVLELRRRNK